MRKAIAACGAAVFALAAGAGILEVQTRLPPHHLLYPLGLLCAVGGMLLGIAFRMGLPPGEGDR